MGRILRSASIFLGIAVLCVCLPTSAQKDEVVHDGDTNVAKYEQMDYPFLAARLRVSGVVVLRLQVDKSGSVLSASAISGKDLLIAAALENARKWRFNATSNGTVILVCNFVLDERLCTPCQSLFLWQGPNLITITTGSLPIQG